MTAPHPSTLLPRRVPPPLPWQAPAYSIGRRMGDMDDPLNNAPGPGAYSPLERRSTPAYSLSFRPRDRVEPTPAPGPGEYQPLAAMRQALRSAPAYSLRPRTGEPTGRGSTPGPGAYTVPLRPQTPQYTLASRLKDFSLREASGIPGPGLYKPRQLRDGSWRNMGVVASKTLAAADL